MFSPDDAALFAKVVDCGGFSAAARVTGHPKSTLSKRIARGQVLAAVAPAGVAPTAVDSDSRRSSGDPPGLAA